MYPSLPHLDPLPRLLPAVAPPWRAPLAAPGVAATRERVRARTRELAVRAGRDPLDVTQADYEQAKREVTGETEPDRQNALLDAALRPPPAPPIATRAPAAPGQTTPPSPVPSPP